MRSRSTARRGGGSGDRLGPASVCLRSRNRERHRRASAHVTRIGRNHTRDFATRIASRRLRGGHASPEPVPLRHRIRFGCGASVLARGGCAAPLTWPRPRPGSLSRDDMGARCPRFWAAPRQSSAVSAHRRLEGDGLKRTPSVAGPLHAPPSPRPYLSVPAIASDAPSPIPPPRPPTSSVLPTLSRAPRPRSLCTFHCPATSHCRPTDHGVAGVHPPPTHGPVPPLACL